MDEKVKAILVLILNWIVPGVGTLVAGAKKPGIWQLVLNIGGFILGIVLAFTVPTLAFLGWIAMFAAWVWALIFSIKYVIAAFK